MTVDEFCDKEGIGIATYYKLKRAGKIVVEKNGTGGDKTIRRLRAKTPEPQDNSSSHSGEPIDMESAKLKLMHARARREEEKLRDEREKAFGIYRHQLMKALLGFVAELTAVLSSAGLNAEQLKAVNTGIKKFKERLATME